MSIQKTISNSLVCQSNVFENYKVRTVVHNGELFFSVVDVVVVVDDDALILTGFHGLNF